MLHSFWHKSHIDFITSETQALKCFQNNDPSMSELTNHVSLGRDLSVCLTNCKWGGNNICYLLSLLMVLFIASLISHEFVQMQLCRVRRTTAWFTSVRTIRLPAWRVSRSILRLFVCQQTAEPWARSHFTTVFHWKKDDGWNYSKRKLLLKFCFSL